MTRFWIIAIVLRKELVETVRDRRTLARVLLLPVLVYPLLAVVMTKLQSSHAEAQEARPSVVAVWGELPEDVADLLVAKKKLTLAPWRGADETVRRLLATDEGALGAAAETPEAGPDARDKERRRVELQPSSPSDPLLPAVRAALAGGEVDAVLAVPARGAAAYAGGGSLPLVAYVDSVRDNSAFAGRRFESAFERVGGALVDARVAGRGLPEGFAHPTAVALRDAAPEDRRTGSFLGLVLPMLLMMMSLLGVFMPAIDLTAGEKERGTLQTLLCAPITAFEMMAGKFLAVWCVSLLMGGANVLSFALTVRRILPGRLPVPTWTYFATFALLVPVTGLLSAVFLAVAAFAKDFKDGQNILMPLYLPCSLLGSASLMPGVEIDRVTALVPIVNVVLLIKAVLMQRAAIELVFVTVAVTVVYALLAVVLAARVFAGEEVLLGGRESVQTLLRRRTPGGEGDATPSAGQSLSVFAWVLVTTFYGSVALEKVATLPRVWVVQLGFFLAPVIAFTLAARLDVRATLALRRPAASKLFAGLLVGASGWSLALAVTSLFPPPKEFVEGMERELFLGGAPLGVVLLTVSVLPALCEEIVFRGFVFAGLRRMGPAVAIVGSALLFGVAHGSVYRLLPTTTLGLLLGAARERSRSLWPGVVLHATNNALLVTVARMRPAWARGEAVPAAVFAAGLVIVAVGAALLARREEDRGAE